MLAKWYILHTIAGSENRIKQMIQDKVSKRNMSDLIEQVVVPVIDVQGLKKGKTVNVEKKVMPGYIFIKMVMTDDTWHLIKGIPKISSFLGNRKPQPLSEKEVNDVFNNLERKKVNSKTAQMYSVGETVMVIDGLFDNFNGVIEDINIPNSTVTISVSIFGKSTPLELSFNQIKKVNI